MVEDVVLNDTGPKILLLAAPLPPPFGGIARYVQHALPHLADRGFSVHVIEPPRRNPGVPPRRVERGHVIETREPFRYRQAALFLLRNFLSLLPFLVRYLPALFRVPRFALGEMREMLAWCAAAEQVCRSVEVAVVHAMDHPWTKGAAGLWAARRFGAQSVLSTFGEVVPHRSELRQFDAVSRPFRRISRYVVSGVDVCTSMTEHCRNQVTYLGLDPARLEMVRFVVGMDPFLSARDASNLRRQYVSPQGCFLLFVGQVRPRKGPEVLVRALPAVIRRHPEARLLIVGPDHGGHTRQLEQLATDFGVTGHVEFVGPVSDQALPAYYAACDVFLFPTLTPIECLGLTFVQSMFAARPVIATRIAGAPEVINDGSDGFFVPPRDASAFAERINEVLDLSAESRQEIGRRARERVRSQFREEDVLDDLVQIYCRLSANRSATPG